MSKYTAEDFANAEFARHPDGRIAARLYPGLKEQWAMFESAWGSSDHQLAIDDWVPVPDQVPGRTITNSQVVAAIKSTDAAYRDGFADALEVTGTRIVPDPEPTNAEKLEALLEGGDINAQWGLRGGGVMFARELAHALDEAGVKAPGGDDE